MIVCFELLIQSEKHLTCVPNCERSELRVWNNWEHIMQAWWKITMDMCICMQ